MILKNNVIVFLGNTRSDGPIKSTSLFIAQNLAKDNKVYFIDYPFTLKDYFKYLKSDLKKDREKKFSIFSDGLIDTEIPNLKIVITPPVLPINFLSEGIFFRFCLKINENLICLRLKKIFKQNKIDDFVFINSFNFHYPGIANLIKPKLTVYQCVDPMIIPYDMKHGIKSERELVKESDIVICTSKALYEEKINLNLNTYFVPNGGDSTLKTDIDNLKEAIHPYLKKLKKPIIGYLGTIERRINYDLIEKVIKKNQDKTFVFAGPQDSFYIPETMYTFSNVHFVGQVEHTDVSSVISGFDVAIIPFKKDDVSATIFPIKLFEYLSEGIPVVCTDFNIDLQDFTEDLIEYCETASQFSDALKRALENDDLEQRLKRKILASNNTWEKRTQQISEIINSHLD